jgi:hypothetical protein
LARIAVVGLLARSLVAVIPGPAHAAFLTPRQCADPIISGDGVRRLDVCARGWNDGSSQYTRAVVEMHTYAWVGGGANQWVDSRSRSITLESANQDCCGNDPWQNNWDTIAVWGQQQGGFPGGDYCRVNGPGGSVGCSVPNTIRVAFYGPARFTPFEDRFVTLAATVSWRDDRGVAHPNSLVFDPDSDTPPLVSPSWIG